MCHFILPIIFIGFSIPVNVSFSFNFSYYVPIPDQSNIKDLMWRRFLKRLSGQARLLNKSGRVKIKAFDRL